MCYVRYTIPQSTHPHSLCSFPSFEITQRQCRVAHTPRGEFRRKHHDDRILPRLLRLQILRLRWYRIWGGCLLILILPFDDELTITDL